MLTVMSSAIYKMNLKMHSVKASQVLTTGTTCSAGHHGQKPAHHVHNVRIVPQVNHLNVSCPDMNVGHLRNVIHDVVMGNNFQNIII